MSSSDSTPSPPSGSTSASTSGKGEAISPPPSASKKAKHGDDDNSSNTEFIENFLECTICLDFPASPIHTCESAHVLCGRCAPKFVACPTCQDPTLRPNPLGEKLAREAKKKVDCVNLEAGCKEGVLSTQIMDHLSLCYFREISCNNVVNCGVKVQFHEYVKHLEDVHKEKIRIGPKSTNFLRYDEKDFTNSGTTFDWIQWEQTVIKFRGHQFILHARVFRQSQLFFSWVSVLGDKDLGDQFIAEIKFHNKTCKKLGCAWRLQVLAFHDMPPNPSEAQLFEYSEQCGALSVPIGAIRKWGELDADQILRFGVTYDIKEA